MSQEPVSQEAPRERPLSEAGPAARQRWRAVLERRARELARPREGRQGPRGAAHVLFTVGGEPFAVDAPRVVEVRPVEGRSRVPGGRAPLVGAINVRGEVRSLFDVRSALGLEGPRLDPDRCWALLVEADRGVLGLLVEGVEGVAAIDLEGLEPVPPSAQLGCLLGVVPQGPAVVDVPALLRALGLGAGEAPTS